MSALDREDAARSDPLGDAFELGAIRVGLFLHVALAIGLCFVPLFDVLGFERAFASGLLAAPTSAAVGISMVRSARTRGGGDLARIASHAVGISLLMLVPTLVAGVIFELVTQPCDQEQGFLFLLLVAGGNALFGTALGVLFAVVTVKRFLPGLLVSGALVGFIGSALLALYADPQIFVYSLPFGFWPGSLYDEELRVNGTLWAFRGFTLLAALAIISVARAFSDPRTLELRLEPPLRVTALLGTTLLFLVAIAVYENGESLGFDLDRGTIERALSRHVTSEHFDLYISPSVTGPEASALLEEHELRHEQLTRFFGVAPEGRIKSFVYASSDEKARLMGAGNTQIARPWAKEIHVNGFSVPHPVVKHELAHVFAGALASGPFRVPAFAGIFVNIGVVEGIAVAADWPVNELTVHGWTRAMRELGLAPNLRGMLHPAGFWAISSARAYTVAGSFVRWLAERYGMEKLAVLYATNDFTAAYGSPLDGLVTEWEAFIDALPLPRDELAIAQHRFSRPGIFQKVCAHKAANLTDEGYQRLHSGDLEGGIELLEQVLRYTPTHVRLLVDIGAALARAGRLDDARRYAKRALDTPGITEKSRAEALELGAGLSWRDGDLEAARAAYEQVLRLHLSGASDRLQLARLAALSRPEGQVEVLEKFLLGDLSSGRALVELGLLAEVAPRDPLPRYLYARQLEAVEAWEHGVRQLEVAMAEGLPAGPLADEAELTLGRLLLRSGRPEDARRRFEAAAARATSPAVRQTAEDWAERARFIAERRSENPPHAAE